MFGGFHEECGIAGVWGHPEASNLAYLSLYALQHRGQESAGIVSCERGAHYSHRGMGLVADVFKQKTLQKLPGSSAIGHCRYSTTGDSFIKNAQPFVVDYARGPLAVAHNGNLVNTMELRGRLEAAGSIFQSTMDTEVIIHLIALSREQQLPDRIIDALSQVRGAYSIVFLSDQSLIAVRDPHGFRPMVLGQLNGGWVVVSESCALDLIGATYVREIEAGEMVIINHRGIHSRKPFPPAKLTQCIFEYVYFARPDSRVYGRNVYEVRKELGRQLAREQGVEGADMVIPVPDSGVPGAIGYAQEAGIPMEMALIRNHYIGRTFIEPQQSIRNFGVKLKLNPIGDTLRDKVVVVIDDSIVRGTTSRKIIEMIRNQGAREVHMRITSPPTIGPCYYGVDTPDHTQLIAADMTVEDVGRSIQADSLAYLAPDGMFRAAGAGNGLEGQGYCAACFTGDYPVTFKKVPVKQMGLFEIP